MFQIWLVGSVVNSSHKILLRQYQQSVHSCFNIFKGERLFSADFEFSAFQLVWSEMIVAGVVKATDCSVWIMSGGLRHRGQRRGASGNPNLSEGTWQIPAPHDTTEHRHRRHTCKRAIYRVGLSPRRQIKQFIYLSRPLSVITSSFEMWYLFKCYYLMSM